MRFQGDLLPPGGEDLRWRETRKTRRMAKAIHAALAAAGIAASVERDETGDGEKYLAVGLAEPEGTVVAVCDGGGFVVADSFEDSEQEQYAAFLTALRVVEQASDWRLTDDDEASLVQDAAYHGVDRAGQVVVPATITEDELDDALIRLAPRSTTAVDRPRPTELTSSPELTELGALLAGGLPAGLLPATRYYELSTGSLSTSGESGLSDDDDDRESDLALELYSGLGDTTSGRPTQVRVHVGTDRTATVEVRFDSLPDNESGSMRTFGWESYIVAMASRDPDWVPDWVPDALALLRAAGRGV